MTQHTNNQMLTIANIKRWVALRCAMSGEHVVFVTNFGTQKLLLTTRQLRIILFYCAKRKSKGQFARS